MSKLFGPRNAAILAMAGTVGYLFFPTPASPTTNPFETQGSKNIGNRWSSGGGSDVHTPGAATKRGSYENTAEPQQNPKGINTPHYQENQVSQRPGEPGPFDKAWNKSHYGTEKGK
ncbi:hypothetical protein MBLNU457_3616t1 [Dothideomycetes sp. NU457]